MTDKIETRTFLGLLLFVTVLFIWILTPFFAAVFWALALTIVFYPLHARLCKKIPQRENLTAAITLLSCLVMVVIPLVIIITATVLQAVDIYQTMQDEDFDLQGYINDFSDKVPVVGGWIEQQDVDVNSLRERLSESLSSGGKFLAQGTWIVGQGLLGFFIQLAVMLYVSFFFLRDGKKIVAGLAKALPLHEKREHLLFKKFAEVTRATIKGNIVIAMVEGALGGIIFWVLGIPAALLWGVLMAILSLIPAIGAGLVWGPVALYLILTGELWQGVGLIAYGLIIIGLVDNFLRPILVGRDTRMPDYIILLSTLGGLVLFGAHGFVIGPIIAALFMVVWGIFMREFQHQDPPKGLLDENSC